MTTPHTGVLNAHLHAPAVELDAISPAADGVGTISRTPVWADGGQSHGIWQMTPGVIGNIAGPESVCILSGSATVQVEPSGLTYELTAGDVFVIGHGETATWTVTETVRKFYVVNR